MVKLIKDSIRLKESRKEYRIKPIVKFYVDNNIFSFIPTVVWQPWIYRYINSSVVDIWWLHFHILIGTWEYKS